MGLFGNIFKLVLKKQFLRTIFNCFQEQNSDWELKYGKQFSLLLPHEVSVRLCTM